MSQITMRIRGHTLPGLKCGGAVEGHPQPYDPIHLGIQRGREVVNIIPNHCCVVSNMVDEVFGIRDGRVEVEWPVVARGATK